jgi:hypothetical protein
MIRDALQSTREQLEADSQELLKVQ